MVAPTCYDTPSPSYVFSIARTREALTAAGIQSAYLLLVGNCHVDDARNAVVRDFLASDCDEVIFIDADVDWEPKHIVQLCGRDLDLVGGVYPYRRDGSDNMPVRMLDGSRLRADALSEGGGLPTGFLKIKRRVLEALAAHAPRYFDKTHETAMVFARPVPGDDLVRWGGDIDFCNRWRAMGGKLYADAELRLGHPGGPVPPERLAGHLRFVRNPYAADAGVLALVVGMARKCRGPIIETGSGLSSLAMGAVSSSQVYALEHSPVYAAQTVAWCEEAGVPNVGVCCAPMKDDWYDLDAFDLPRKFALGFCDGPPRMFGTRMQFFAQIAPRCEAIVVDDVKTDAAYLRKVADWAEANGRTFQILGRAALILKKSPEQLKAAA